MATNKLSSSDNGNVSIPEKKKQEVITRGCRGEAQGMHLIAFIAGSNLSHISISLKTLTSPIRPQPIVPSYALIEDRKNLVAVE